MLKVFDQTSLEGYYKGTTRKAHAVEQRIAGVKTIGDYGESDCDTRMHTHSLDNIRPYIEPATRIVDIGCGTGHILHLLKHEGYCNVYGIEPSRQACEIATQRYGIEVFKGSLFDYHGGGRFDFAILSHVMEHVVDLRLFLLRLHSILNENSMIYIEVPDLVAFTISIDPSCTDSREYTHDIFAQFSPEHVNFFVTASLSNLMKSSGFKEVLCMSQISAIGVIASVWRRLQLVKAVGSEEELDRYIEACNLSLVDCTSIIASLVMSGTELIIWGAGLHTQRLLAISELSKANIAAFVDSDPRYQGADFIGRPILPPGSISQFPNSVILISTRRFQTEIQAEIARLNLPNRVVSLYPKDLA